MPTNRKSLEPFDDDPWDVFLPDDDQVDPQPEPGDFWPDYLEDLPFTDELNGRAGAYRGRGGV